MVYHEAHVPTAMHAVANAYKVCVNQLDSWPTIFNIALQALTAYHNPGSPTTATNSVRSAKAVLATFRLEAT